MIIGIAHAASQAALHEQETGLLGTFGLDWKLFLAQLINFAIIVFVLTKWVYKPLLHVMDERRKKMERGIKQAQEAQRKLDSASEEKKQIINEARSVGKQYVDEGKKKGDLEREQRIDASKTIIERQLKESKELLERETALAKEQARKELATLVITATEKVSQNVLDDTQHRKLIENSLNQLERTHD